MKTIEEKNEHLPAENNESDQTEQRLATWLCIGLAIGAGIGSLFDNLATGVGLGMALGVCVGAFPQVKKKRKK